MEMNQTKYYIILKLRYCEKATKFKKYISHLFWRLLSKFKSNVKFATRDLSFSDIKYRQNIARSPASNVKEIQIWTSLSNVIWYHQLNEKGLVAKWYVTLETVQTFIWNKYKSFFPSQYNTIL